MGKYLRLDGGKGHGEPKLHRYRRISKEKYASRPSIASKTIGGCEIMIGTLGRRATRRWQSCADDVETTEGGAL